ncbi:MAG TPA: uracil phosphoribosyltransferase [Candidatus Baltobacteraceae bacterium]|jgi:uracil phosphoribosyltransferase|nr:uracil phosphoribosyltransferase [Candidatus Baltobacteraceae bacterium]
MKNVVVVDHPLVKHNLTRLRNKNTQHLEFRRLLGEISLLMSYEIARSFETREVKIETPLEETNGTCLTHDVALIPVLRAGLGMLEPILKILPNARVGFIGLKRDEITLEPTFYYESFPKNLGELEVVLIDPMLATGGTVSASMALLARNGARRVKLLSLLASPEGIEHVRERFPDLVIYTAAIDRCLNDKGYIMPGLGDAGDRLFGTA